MSSIFLTPSPQFQAFCVRDLIKSIKSAGTKNRKDGSQKL